MSAGGGDRSARRSAGAEGAENAGGVAGAAVEQAAEIQRVGVTDAERDLGDGEVGRAQEQFRFIHAEVDETLFRRAAETATEQADELRLGVACLPREDVCRKVGGRVPRQSGVCLRNDRGEAPLRFPAEKEQVARKVRDLRHLLGREAERGLHQAFYIFEETPRVARFYRLRAVWQGLFCAEVQECERGGAHHPAAERHPPRAKDHLSRTDLEVLIDRISVYEDRVDIRLRSNIDALLRLDPAKGLTANFNPDTGDIAQEITQKSPNRRGKVIRVNVFSKGDPLEIYTSPDGEVIFKKYSPVGEISCTASQYADVLSKVGGCPAVICDRDHVIAVSGMAKKEVIERRVSGSLEDLIEQRKSHVYRSKEDQRLNPIEGIDRYAIACSPILSQGDVNGAVIMLSGEDNEFATSEQSALVQAAAMYFGKQMEE